MKECSNCNCDISDRGNRATRCEKCQKDHRDAVWEAKHKNEGSTRYNKETSQWANHYGLRKNQTTTISQQDIMDLISCYRTQLKSATVRKALDIKTRIKILDDNYVPDELKETIKEVDHDYAILPHTESINWDKAKTGWTKYYDDGLVTLSPDVFFGKKKVDK